MDSALCCHTSQGACAPSHGLFVMLGIHISHIITDQATLTATDLVHHALSCGMSGYFMLIYRLGAIKNFALFYSCGAPGMLSYLGLFCVKNGLLSRHVNGYWEKGPDGLTNEMPLYVLMSMVFSVSLNGLYFSQLVAVSYGKALAHSAPPPAPEEKGGGKMRPSVSFIDNVHGM